MAGSSSEDDPDRNVAFALGLTFGAGLSTTLGAALSFCIKPSFTDILPISLAFSAGVMIYVSFMEILSKGLEAFEQELEKTHPASYTYLAHICVSVTFFFGIGIGYLLDFVVHLLGYEHDIDITTTPEHQQNNGHQRINTQDDDNNNHLTTGTSQIELLKNEQRETLELESLEQDDDDDEETKLDDIDNDDDDEDINDKRLIKMSLITALAIAIHNFPEGLATFVAALANPTLGISIAVAISIHNIPEGVSVAMPIYFATKSKWKAFFWAFLSGVFEPIGGLIGYAIIDSLFNDIVFGVLFGFTAGIMTYISYKELLPTARRKDINDKYSTILVFVGFFVMDISLILFQYAA